MSGYYSNIRSVEILRDRNLASKSGYHGVYPHRNGWIAKAFKIQVGPVQATSTSAACQLIDWWKDQFGDRWETFFRARKNLARQCFQTPKMAWRVRVWIRGVPTLLTNKHGKILEFTSKREAVSGYERWRKDQFGIFLPISGYWIRKTA